MPQSPLSLVWLLFREFQRPCCYACCRRLKDFCSQRLLRPCLPSLSVLHSFWVSALVLFFPLSFLEHTVLRMTHCPNAFSFPAHSLLITPPEKCHFGNKDDKKILASWQYQKEDSPIKNNSWKLQKKNLFYVFFSLKSRIIGFLYGNALRTGSHTMNV